MKRIEGEQGIRKIFFGYTQLFSHLIHLIEKFKNMITFHMPSTLNIIVNGVIFYVEEKGYKRLCDYLNSVRLKYLGGTRMEEESLEERIAEIFLDKLQDGKDTITLQDVPCIIDAIELVICNPEQ